MGKVISAAIPVTVDHSLFSFFFFFFFHCPGLTLTQAAESIKWRPQQAYGSNQVLLSQPQTIFSTHKILRLTHR